MNALIACISVRTFLRKAAQQRWQVREVVRRINTALFVRITRPPRRWLGHDRLECERSSARSALAFEEVLYDLHQSLAPGLRQRVSLESNNRPPLGIGRQFCGNFPRLRGRQRLRP